MGESPGAGETGDFSQPEEKRQASDLTSRLEDTNVRMRKISDMFDTYEGAYSEEPHTNNSFHPLTRTARIVGVGELADEAEKNQPNLEGSSVNDASPQVYRAVVTPQLAESEE